MIIISQYFISLLILVALHVNVYADLEKSYQEGAEYVDQHTPTKEVITSSNIHDVPGFVTDLPQESSLYIEPTDITEQAHLAATANDGAQNLKITANTRPKFTIDVNNDPLFKTGQLTDPFNIAEQPLGIQLDDMVEKTCEEGGDELTLTCYDNLSIKVVNNSAKASILVRYPNLITRILSDQDVRPEPCCDCSCILPKEISLEQFFNVHSLIINKNLEYFKTKVCPTLVKWGKLNIDCNSVESYSFDHADNTCDRIIKGGITTSFVGWLRLYINYRNAYVDSEEWQNNCTTAESMLDEGLCQYGERILTQGLETRNINGYPVTRNDWQYKQIYYCKKHKDECSPLRAIGCIQIDSKCKEYKNNKCWIYEQKYNCHNGKVSLSKAVSNEGMFCLAGDCHNTSFDTNRDMLDVISKLTILKEVQDDIRSQNNSDNLQIFKGKERKCSRNCVSFKDCCGGMKGWGVSLKLARCKAEEQELAHMRQKNLCHQVGTYCAKKILGKCVSKKTSFCCFGTRFAKVLQEQGRGQLGLNWGTALEPNCCPLTIDQITRLDLSKMNFSELFQDVMQKYKSPNLPELQNKTQEQIAENMKAITDGLKPKTGVIDDKKDSL